MATRNPERPVQLSVLDRLIDAHPENRQEVPLTRSQSVAEFKAALRRDTEWLLNTRRAIHQPEASEGGEPLELAESVYNYGVPDFSSFTLGSGTDLARLTRLLEEAIVRFEPRLQGVRVTPHREAVRGQRSVRFTIEGMLQIEPSPELIAFDTIIDAGGEFHVKGD
jgi:type VI secretion system protein ImpF